jgi:lipopolysaccharide export system permease protein
VRIIDRYIITEFLKVFAICVAGFLLVLLLVEITDKIKYYFEYNPRGWLMVKYFLVKIPGYLFYAIPLGILLGGMLSLLMMARNSEIIAMQANGIDALSVARPVLLVGAISSVLMFVADQTIIPWSNRYSEYVQDVEIAGKRDTALYKSDEIWMRTSQGIVHMGRYDAATASIERLSLVRWDEGFHFRERLFADKARWWRDRWMLYGVNRTVRTDSGEFRVEALPSMEGTLGKTPADLERGEKVAREMNLVQLGDYIVKLQAEGHGATRYLVDWHDKIAFPLVCLIMSALGVPFAVTVNPRGGGVAVGLAVSLVIAFSYWIVHTLFIALGHSGYFPPIAAAWGANVIFGLTATMLLLHSGT